MKLFLILSGLIPKPALSNTDLVDLRGCQPRFNTHLNTIAIINDDFFTTNPDKIVIENLGLFGNPETEITLKSDSHQNRISIIPGTQSVQINSNVNLKDLHTIEATIYCGNVNFPENTISYGIRISIEKTKNNPVETNHDVYHVSIGENGESRNGIVYEHFGKIAFKDSDDDVLFYVTNSSIFQVEEETSSVVYAFSENLLTQSLYTVLVTASDGDHTAETILKIHVDENADNDAFNGVFDGDTPVPEAIREKKSGRNRKNRKNTKSSPLEFFSSSIHGTLDLYKSEIVLESDIRITRPHEHKNTRYRIANCHPSITCSHFKFEISSADQSISYTNAEKNTESDSNPSLSNPSSEFDDQEILLTIEARDRRTNQNALATVSLKIPPVVTNPPYFQHTQLVGYALKNENSGFVSNSQNMDLLIFTRDSQKNFNKHETVFTIVDSKFHYRLICDFGQCKISIKNGLYTNDTIVIHAYNGLHAIVDLSVKVVVYEENNYSPRFEKPGYEVILETDFDEDPSDYVEQNYNGNYNGNFMQNNFLKVEASDYDFGPVVYGLVQEPSQQFFEISEVEGYLSVVKRIPEVFMDKTVRVMVRGTDSHPVEFKRRTVEVSVGVKVSENSQKSAFTKTEHLRALLSFFF